MAMIMIFSQQACLQSIAVSLVSVSRANFGGLLLCVSVGLDRLCAPQARCSGDQGCTSCSIRQRENVTFGIHVALRYRYCCERDSRQAREI